MRDLRVRVRCRTKALQTDEASVASLPLAFAAGRLARRRWPEPGQAMKSMEPHEYREAAADVLHRLTHPTEYSLAALLDSLEDS